MADNQDSKEEKKEGVCTNEIIIEKYKKDKNLRKLNLRDGDYTDLNISLSKAHFDGSDFFRAKLQGLDFSHATLKDSIMKQAECKKVNFTKADLRNVDFTDADLEHSDLSGADLRGCSMARVSLAGAIIHKTKIDRRALRMLGDDHGGLVAADLAELDIEDDQIKLTNTFGGFKSSLHLISLTIFLIPYFVFLLSRYLAAQNSPCLNDDSCVALREALWDYIIRGGNADEFNVIAIVTFFFIGTYQLLRISLVFKSQSLDLEERAAGIPRQFILQGYWKFAYYTCNWFLWWINLILVIWNTYVLLGMRVPPAN